MSQFITLMLLFFIIFTLSFLISLPELKRQQAEQLEIKKNLNKEQ